MSYFRDESKKKESDIGRSGSGKICAILHVHYMHGGPTCLSQKKRKTKVVSQSKNKKNIAARSSLLH